MAEEDIQQVTNWLQSQGFQVNQVYPNKMLIDISGTAGAVAAGLPHPDWRTHVDGEAHIANMSDPQIPAALAPVIKGFASLNDFRPHANHMPVYAVYLCRLRSPAPRVQPNPAPAMQSRRRITRLSTT